MATTPAITKELFLATFSCPTLGWLQNNGQYTQPISLYDKFKMEEGLDIHQRARKLFPKGHLVTGDNITAAKKTKQLLTDKATSVILEATFLAAPYVTKVDVLKRDNSAWKIIEVKSSINIDDELIDDLAYTTMVAKRAGLTISACSLLLINKDYRLGMSNEGLFAETDCTTEVLERVEEFEQCCDEIANAICQKEKPAPELKWECKSCPIFEECCGKDIEHHIFELPRLSHTKFCQLRDMGIVRIEDVPQDFGLTDNQEKVRQAIVISGPVVDMDGLRQALGSIVYPAYYLDFETVQTVIPLYENTAPYDQIPTQYSLRHRFKKN